MTACLELLHRHTGGRQRFGVGDALVPQRIELARRHERRGQARELAAQRRDARIGPVGWRAVEVPEPVHQRARQEVARRILVVGRAIEGAIGDRAYQELAGDRRAAAVARQLAGDGRDVAAGAPARDQQRARPAAQLGCVLGNPAQRRVTVLGGRRKRCSGACRSRRRRDHPCAGTCRVERIVGSRHPAQPPP